MIYKSYENYLLEADDDDKNAGGGGETVDVSPDANEGGGDENADAGDEGSEDADTDDNYDIDAGDADEGGGDDNPEGGDEDTDTEGGDDDGGDTDTGGGLEGEDDEDNEKPEHPEFDKIYSQLTPKEKSYHDHELRQNYKKLYKSVDIMIEKAVKLPRTSETIKPTTELLHTLFDFKKYLVFYIKNTYENKTLIENSIEYWKYMSILSAYRAVFKEITKVLSPENEEKS